MPTFYRVFTLLLLAILVSTVVMGDPGEMDASLTQRVETREYPSAFMAWSSADKIKDEAPDKTAARHDLAILSPEKLGLHWNSSYRGLGDGFQPETVARARAIRARLLQLNPHLVLIAEIRYRDASDRYLPDDSPWWKRETGVRKIGWKEGHYYLLDFGNPGFRSQVVKQAHAVLATELFDGVFFDWWQDDDDRLALLRAVRAAVGNEALIMANSNDLPVPRSAPYLNGLYMECWRSATSKDWRRIASTLQWAERTLRIPRINCVETWFHHSRQDLDLMRATTTLSLTMSDGYCLFGDPDSLPTPDHMHDWYDFWNKSLGRPIAAGVQRPDGSTERQFEKGTAIYNPMGNHAIVVQFASPRRRVSTNETAAQFTIPACDGDIFLHSSGVAIVPSSSTGK